LGSAAQSPGTAARPDLPRLTCGGHGPGRVGRRAGSARRVGPAFRAASSQLLPLPPPSSVRPAPSSSFLVLLSLLLALWHGQEEEGRTPAILEGAGAARPAICVGRLRGGGSAAAPTRGGGRTGPSAQNHDRLGGRESGRGCVSAGRVDAKRDPPLLPRPLSPGSSAKARIRGTTLGARS